MADSIASRRPLTAALAAAGLLAASGGVAQERRGPPPMVPIATPEQPGGIPLYPDGALPRSGAAQAENWGTFDAHFKVVRNVTVRTLTPYLPHRSKASGAAVVVAPGGAFMMLAIDAEGKMVARWLAERGIAAFVLKYRVEPTPPDQAGFLRAMGARMAAAATSDRAAGAPPTFQSAVDDGIAAMRMVRARAAQWGVDPKRVGMIGFSAGAMSALSVTMAGQPDARPDFVGLIYGPMFPARVPANAPPLFAAIAADDGLFGRNGFGLIESWRQAGGSVEFHLYHAGDHGFGMRDIGTTAALWPEQFVAWMKSNKLLERSGK